MLFLTIRTGSRRDQSSWTVRCSCAASSTSGTVAPISSLPPRPPISPRAEPTINMMNINHEVTAWAHAPGPVDPLIAPMPEEIVPILHVRNAHETAKWYSRLGFKVEGEHQFGPGMPYYLFLGRGGIHLHLSEHQGDARGPTPCCISTSMMLIRLPPSLGRR